MADGGTAHSVHKPQPSRLRLSSLFGAAAPRQELSHLGGESTSLNFGLGAASGAAFFAQLSMAYRSYRPSARTPHILRESRESAFSARHPLFRVCSYARRP
jgi:hypothetical protein